MKRLFSLLLVAVMLLSLAACGGGDADPDAGKYLGVSGEMMGITMTMEELYPGESYLELQSGGKAVLVLEGDKITGEWILEGETFNLVVEGENCPGTLKDGIIVFDLAGSGVMLTFAKEGSSTPKATEPAGPIGLYQGTTYEYSGQKLQMSDAYRGICSLELLDGGKAVLTLTEQKMDCTWTLDGESFILDNVATKSTGTLKGDTVTIDFMNMGMMLTFVKGGASQPDNGNAEDASLKPGSYSLCAIDQDGEYLNSDWINRLGTNAGNYIIVYDDGTADLCLDGELISCTYDDEYFTQGEYFQIKYAVVDGIVELNVDDGTIFYYAEGEIVEAPQGGDTYGDGEFPEDIIEELYGDWHGWCVIYNATGAYESDIDTEFEMLARYAFYEDGSCEPWMAIYADPDSNFQDIALTYNESDEYVYLSGKLFGMDISDTSSMYSFSGALNLSIDLEDDNGTMNIAICMRHPDDVWDAYDYPCMPDDAIEYYSGMSFEEIVEIYELDPDDLPELP